MNLFQGLTTKFGMTLYLYFECIWCKVVYKSPMEYLDITVCLFYDRVTRMATWPSGKAEACKAFTPGSNPGVAFFILGGNKWVKFLVYQIILFLQ